MKTIVRVWSIMLQVFAGKHEQMPMFWIVMRIIHRKNPKRRVSQSAVSCQTQISPHDHQTLGNLVSSSWIRKNPNTSRLEVSNGSGRNSIKTPVAQVREKNIINPVINPSNFESNGAFPLRSRIRLGTARFGLCFHRSLVPL